MDVLIDDELANPPLDSEKTLAEMIDEVRRRLSDSSRMVMAIEGDGVELNSEALERAMTRPASSFQRIVMRTCAPAELVEAALDEALSSLQQARVQCASVVELLTQSNTTEAMIELGGVLRTWQEVHEGMRNGIGLLGVELQHLSSDSGDIETVFAEVRELLVQIKDVIQSRDTVLLADLLQYEFEPVADKWEYAIRLIRDHAAGLLPAGAT